MKKSSTEFYLGICIWLIEIPITYNIWLSGEESDIHYIASTTNVVIVGFIFILYLLGYVIFHQGLTNRRLPKSSFWGLAISSISVLALSTIFFFGMVALMATMLIIQLAGFIQQKKALLLAVLVPTVCVLVDYSLGKVFEYTTIVIYSTLSCMPFRPLPGTMSLATLPSS